MDSNIPNIQESWDWEKRINEMNMDLLITWWLFGFLIFVLDLFPFFLAVITD